MATAAPASPQTQAPSATLARPPTLARATPQPTRGGIDWKAAALAAQRYANQAPKLTAGLNRAALDKTRVPVLLPADPALTEGARLYSFGDYYSLSGDIPGAGLSLTGTTAKVSFPGKLTVSPQGPQDLVIQRTVDGQLASFVRYGVLYTAEIRCDAPSDDRCRSDAYVRQLVNKLTVVVLGKAARQAAGLEG